MANSLDQDYIKKIEELKTQVERLSSIRPQYTILNLSPVISLTADQTNYDLGSYDVIHLAPTAARIIRGITNGVDGRILWIRNESNFNLSLTHADVLATDINRFVNPSGATITLAPLRSAVLIYMTVSAGRWRTIFPAA